MKTSVIISTMNRPSTLLRLAQNLLSQDLAPNEMIVVEAGGLNWTSSMLSDDYHIDCVFIDGKGTSLSQARELGRISANNEILIFLDDDVILPKNYISDVVEALSADNDTLAVGGAYSDYGQINKKKWKTCIGRLLGIYSDGKKNRILKSGWADYVRGTSAGIVTSADWLFGCNWAVKAKAFQDSKVKIETNLARWSFLEDVIVGYRLIEAYGDCLKILPNLSVVHDPMASSGEISPETIRMRILYRYVFWRYELYDNCNRPSFDFVLGMFANTILMFVQVPKFSVLLECFLSYKYILIQQPKSYRECNDFIFKK